MKYLLPHVPWNTSLINWSKRAGIVGLGFFLVKGLLWIIVPVFMMFLAR